MRRLTKLWKPVCVVACAVLFLMATPHGLESPQLPVPVGTQACRVKLGQTPQKPKPNECWNAVASWYGPHFEGQTTATGTPFNMYAATAAHRSLPLGSIVRVSNPQTGKSMVVTINDRGPYVRGRGLDVSYEVARLLGFAQQGVCRVQIEMLRLPAATWLPTRAKD
jgi:rare lipoprotein A (peptidoglycan hydrolase)